MFLLQELCNGTLRLVLGIVHNFMHTEFAQSTSYLEVMSISTNFISYYISVLEIFQGDQSMIV